MLSEERHSVASLQRWVAGEPVSATKLNVVTDTLSAFVTGVRPPRQLNTGRAETLAVTANSARQYSLVADAGDWLLVREITGSRIFGPVVFLAKPYLLRITPFDGQTRAGISYVYEEVYQRVATRGLVSETQVVVPQFVEGDLIYGVNFVANGTNLIAANSLHVTGLDLNVDGRAWARKFV